MFPEHEFFSYANAIVLVDRKIEENILEIRFCFSRLDLKLLA